MLFTVAVTILVLGVLIFVHELGHFLAAKSVGIAVLRFSLGLGPATRLRLQRGETEYCLSWIPFGGYVKMAGLEEDETGLEGARAAIEVPPERTFEAQPLWARIWVISAGVVMNALFCVALYAVIARAYGTRLDPTTTVYAVREAELPAGAGPVASLRKGDRILRINDDTVASWSDVASRLLTTRQTPVRITVEGRARPVLVDVPMREQQARLAVARAIVPWRTPVLGRVMDGWPAAAAGLMAGDRIVRVDSESIETWDAFVRAVSSRPEQRTEIAALRAPGDTVLVRLTPRAMAEGNRRVGRIGVERVQRVVRHTGVGAIVAGVREAGGAAGLVLFTLKGLVMGDLSPRDLGGPILIGQLSGEAARQGLRPLLALMALISMNLAVLNLLPIPVLDGGHLLFLLAEGVRRRPVSLAVRQRLTQAGLLMLIGIMLLALFNDVTRPFGR